jgi:hypothetical protein
MITNGAAATRTRLCGASLPLLGMLGLVRAWRGSLALSLGAGAVGGAACYFAGPTAAALVSGLAGFAGSLATLVFRSRQTVALVT